MRRMKLAQVEFIGGIDTVRHSKHILVVGTIRGESEIVAARCWAHPVIRGRFHIVAERLLRIRSSLRISKYNFVVDATTFSLSWSPWCVLVTRVISLVLLPTLLCESLVMVFDILGLLFPHVADDL